MPADGAWLVEDLGSTNGTYLDRDEGDPADAGAARRSRSASARPCWSCAGDDAHAPLSPRAPTSGCCATATRTRAYAGPRLLAVADGMGGHAAGEVASAVAIAALAPLDEDAPGADLLDALRGAAMSANARLHDMVDGDSALDGMGTTLTAMLVGRQPARAAAHRRLARATCCATASCTQITHDHTLVQTPRRRGPDQRGGGRAATRSATSSPRFSTAATSSSSTCRCARCAPATATCSAATACPASSATDTLREALSAARPAGGRRPARGARAARRRPGQHHRHRRRRRRDRPPVAIDAGRRRCRRRGTAGATARCRRDGRRPGPHCRGRDRRGSTRAVADASRRRRAVPRIAVIAAVVGLLLVAGAGGGWAYVRSQYYVGADGRQVAVFRGVTGHVAGVDLSSIEERSDLRTDQLGELDAARVKNGIVAKSKSDAQQILERLKSLACPTPLATPAPTAATDPAPTAATVPRPPPPAVSVSLPAPPPTPTAAGCP